MSVLCESETSKATDEKPCISRSSVVIDLQGKPIYIVLKRIKIVGIIEPTVIFCKKIHRQRIVIFS